MRERVAASETSQARAQANLARARVVAQQAQADLARTESLARQGLVSSTKQESAQLGVEDQHGKAVFDWQDASPAVLSDGYKMELCIALQQASDVPLARNSQQAWPPATLRKRDRLRAAKP